MRSYERVSFRSSRASRVRESDSLCWVVDLGCSSLFKELLRLHMPGEGMSDERRRLLCNASGFETGLIEEVRLGLSGK